MSYKNKYLKYKNKYLEFKKQLMGGAQQVSDIDPFTHIKISYLPPNQVIRYDNKYYDINGIGKWLYESNRGTDENNVTIHPNEVERIKIAYIIYRIRQNSNFFDSLLPIYKNNRDVVVALVTQDGSKLRIVTSFLNDRGIVFRAVRQNGLALKFARTYQDDRDVVLSAVRQNGMALKYVSDDLRNDIDVVYTAYKQNEYSIEFASERMKNEINAANGLAQLSKKQKA
jgi:hypothetical protein